MTERDALYRAIAENPEEDTPRLALADLLDEQDDHEKAEIIRLQVELDALNRVPRVPHNRPVGRHPGERCDLPCEECAVKLRRLRIAIKLTHRPSTTSAPTSP